MSTDEDQNQQPPSAGPSQGRRVDRRTFVKGSLAAGGLIAAGGLGIDRFADASEDSGQNAARSAAASVPPPPTPAQPNILVILVDQLRYPAWFSPTADGTGLPPNLRRLRQGAVSFAGHYTASNDCTPARATLLTGLYTHQTGCMITGGSTLDPGFPTWGTMLREHGYETRWYGKWHLTHHDGKWGRVRGERALARYGFAGGTFPSPNGAPGQGWRLDGHIAQQFGRWFKHERTAEPWCTTVSFVNPHDIAWWYVWSDRVAAEASAHPVTEGLPANFETPGLLIERGKPMLQRSLQETAAASFGPVPFEGPEVVALWSDFLNLYAKLQREVDRHIGHVLDTLESRPDVAANTVVVFTSDHGEYGGSHGLRGKGAGAYEEAIHVPLLVKDYRGQLTQASEAPRTQLDLERRHRPAAADDRHRLGRLARRIPLRPPRRTRRPRGDPRRPGRSGAPVRRAHDRRDGDRVRDRTVRRRRAAPCDRRTHPRGQVRDVLRLAGRRDRSDPGGPGRGAV